MQNDGRTQQRIVKKAIKLIEEENEKCGGFSCLAISQAAKSYWENCPIVKEYTYLFCDAVEKQHFVSLVETTALLYNISEKDLRLTMLWFFYHMSGD